MAEWVIERLDKSHERGSFCCGKDSLDLFLKTLVSQYQKKRVGRTFVVTASGDKKVLGYYTVAAGSISLNALPEDRRKGLPKHPIPTLHLGRLAVDQSCQGQGLGALLLFHFLRKALEASEAFGVYAVDVWAMDEQALPFYLKYGFIPLADAPLHLYLPIGTVEQLFSE
jgi:GNAT superfamily N-acetyltransferase